MLSCRDFMGWTCKQCTQASRTASPQNPPVTHTPLREEGQGEGLPGRGGRHEPQCVQEAGHQGVQEQSVCFRPTGPTTPPVDYQHAQTGEGLGEDWERTGSSMPAQRMQILNDGAGPGVGGVLRCHRVRSQSLMSPLTLSQSPSRRLWQLKDFSVL
ncbi:hypothetical protein AOXY_G33926 [Acipenser oxyrinchus oxyrinchus]|uniref:Uncharacterized protein n=1 Tax=Acipenser oxyrinchus oxyrinchus TaxID=40147 RepID=A0AAD8FQM8_ACIOX|nr:hypothetical protein AOXY_G33926 [Acipenser oxyrinchus oxyrinchus]